MNAARTQRLISESDQPHHSYAVPDPRKALSALLRVSVLTSLATCIGCSFQGFPISTDAADAPVAFVGVNVIPMDTNRILEDQTVIVQDGVITEIAATSPASVPDGTVLVDGTGKYLMPGLADMHVHISSDRDLFLFLAHGVTTVQNMWGNDGIENILVGQPKQIDQRNRVNAGTLLGPTIHTAGPLFEGNPPTQPFMPVITSVEQAAATVRSQQAAGYDFIKVYDNLAADVYQAIVDTATELGLRVKGHVPFALGLDGVLESGQKSIEHLIGYINPNAAELDIPASELATYAQRTAERGVWNCPTVVVWQKLVPASQLPELRTHPGLEYLPPSQRLFLDISFDQFRATLTYTGDDYTERMATLGYEVIQALHDAGAGLLLGTDCGNPYVFPGWSAHEELQYLVDAGLTPYEALRTGTVNAAESLDMAAEFGSVQVGMRADLILLDANPLENVANAQEIAGVMVRGLWLPREQIDKLLEKLTNASSVTIAR